MNYNRDKHVIAFIKDSQTFGNVLHFGKHKSLIEVDQDDHRWFNNDDWFPWETITFKHFSLDKDEQLTEDDQNYLY